MLQIPLPPPSPLFLDGGISICLVDHLFFLLQCAYLKLNTCLTKLSVY